MRYKIVQKRANIREVNIEYSKKQKKNVFEQILFAENAKHIQSNINI